MTSPRLQTSDHAGPRRTGAIVGLIVAGIFLAAGFPILLQHQRLEPTTLLLTQGIPTLVAGVVGGWLLAPRAARASTRRAWVGVALRLGVVAMLVGAIGVGMALAFDSAIRSGTNAGEAITLGIVGGLMAATVGLLLLSWLMLPLTTLAAGIWAVVMARLMRRHPRNSR